MICFGPSVQHRRLWRVYIYKLKSEANRVRAHALHTGSFGKRNLVVSHWLQDFVRQMNQCGAFTSACIGDLSRPFTRLLYQIIWQAKSTVFQIENGVLKIIAEYRAAISYFSYKITGKSWSDVLTTLSQPDAKIATLGTLYVLTQIQNIKIQILLSCTHTICKESI